MKKLQFCFWIVLLGHLLFFLTLSIQWKAVSRPKIYDNPLAAYVYKEETNSEASKTLMPTLANKRVETSPEGIQKAVKPTKTLASASSAQATKGSGDQNINLSIKTEKPLNKPLLKILTKATVAHLIYPKIAVDFRTKGSAQVGFNISPNGQVTEVALLKSSGIAILDKAAMAAIRNMSPVQNVSPYLEKKEFLVVNIVFG